MDLEEFLMKEANEDILLKILKHQTSDIAIIDVNYKLRDFILEKNYHAYHCHNVIHAIIDRFFPKAESIFINTWNWRLK